MWEVIQNRRVLAGAGQLAGIGQVLAPYGARAVFLLTYRQDAPAIRALIDNLTAAGIQTAVDDSLAGEPSTEDIDRIAGAMVRAGASVVLAVGGGSVLDAAKAAAMLATNGGAAAEYQTGARAITNKPLPIVAVPTTAGTGSEATKVAVLYNPATRLKKSIYSPDMIAETVILDPTLTLGLPPDVTVSTGIDAMSHAIESLVSLNATPYTKLFGLGALRLVWENLAACVKNPDDVHARGQMQLASYMGGMAINAGIGLAHIIAQPLGGMLGIPHGVACAIFLPHAMEYNLDDAMPMYCEIARVLGASGADSPQLARAAVSRVRDFLKALGAPDSIRGYLPEGGLDMDEAIQIIWAATGHVTCNPRRVDKGTIRRTLAAVI